jgi:CysZ protein
MALANSGRLFVVSEPPVDERPGRLRRAAAGAWHVPAGLTFLLGRPRLWALAALPAALALAFLVGGLGLGIVAIPWVEGALAPSRERVPDWVGFPITLGLWAGTIGAGMALGLGVALLFSAPILDRLSQRVELLTTGRTRAAGRGLRWEILESLRGAFYFLAAAPGVLLLALVPLVGPVLGGLWGAFALSFQLTDGPLARRGLDFRSRRRWHRRWRAESEGFGLAGLLALLVPLANLLLSPALVVGATRLVLELEQGPPAAADDPEATSTAGGRTPFE